MNERNSTARLPFPAFGAAMLLGALSALVAGPSRLAAQVPTEVRLCLQDYALLSRSGDDEAALDKLRACTAAHPEIFQLQKTLGKKLAERAEETGDEELVHEAIAAWERAAELDGGRFAALYGELAALLQRVGRDADALAAHERSLDYLTATERQEAEDQLFRLYLEQGAGEKALELWPRLAYRHADDHASQVGAARLLQAAGRADDAKLCWQRALELEPGDAEAREAYHGLLASTASSGGSSDKNALLDAWLPKLASADAGLLEQLLGITRQVLRPDAARPIALELLGRRPGHAGASVVLAEAAQSDGDEQGAMRFARQALQGSLDEDSRGRCHALLGRLIEAQAYARYQRAPEKTGGELVASVDAEYDRALSHYREAQAAGLDMSREIQTVRAAQRAIGGQRRDLDRAEVAAAERACEKLGSEARYAYDRDKPLARAARRDMDLARSAGGEDSGNELARGTEVVVMDTAWSGGCWLKVKTEDGRQGWAPKAGFSS